MMTSCPMLEGGGGALSAPCSECAPAWLEPEGETVEASSMTASELVAKSPPRPGAEVDDDEGPVCVENLDNV